MPSNVTRTAQFYDKEVLKYATDLGGVPIKSVVIDSNDLNTITVDGSLRNVIPAGTILKASGTYPNRSVKYQGTGTILGVLAHSVDILANATNANEPANAFFTNVVFATKSIVGFTQYASACVSTLNLCKWE